MTKNTSREIGFKIEISVLKSKGDQPVLIAMEPCFNEFDEEDWRELATVSLSNKEYKIWRKGTMFQKLQMVMEAFEKIIELDEMHRPLIK